MNSCPHIFWIKTNQKKKILFIVKTSFVIRQLGIYGYQYVHVFLSSDESKLKFLRKTFQDFSPYSLVDFNGLKVQIAVSMQL